MKREREQNRNAVKWNGEICQPRNAKEMEKKELKDKIKRGAKNRTPKKKWKNRKNGS